MAYVVGRSGPCHSFIQFFGSALQVTPHFHSLVPDGVFVPREGGVRFEPLPPPTQAGMPTRSASGRSSSSVSNPSRFQGH